MQTEVQFGVINVQHMTHLDSAFYAIDANKKVLYHLDTKSMAWQCKALRELGID